MVARVVTVVAALALLAGTVQSVAAQEPPTAPPEIVQIEDPAGDANYLNGQGFGVTEGDRTTPQDLTISDILKVWFTHDAQNVSLNIQTEAPPPSGNAAYLYRAFTNPGGDYTEGCLWWEGFVEGPTFVGESFARLRDLCAGSDPVEGTLAIATLADETGLVTITLPRAAHELFADGSVLVGPNAEVRNLTGAAAVRFATAPVVDDTKVGADYTITPVEDADDGKPKKKKKNKKG
jgi:hypothetical protein